MSNKAGLSPHSVSLRQRLLQALFLFRRPPPPGQDRRGSSLPVFLCSGAALLVVNCVAPPPKDYHQAFPADEARIACRLVRVLDGDTLTAHCGGRYLSIRLQGIDAPEQGQVPWGAQSQAALQGLMSSEFQLLPRGQDVYRRQLGIIFVRGQDVNQAMLRQGQAVLYKSKDTPQVYAAAEAGARAQRLGVWAQNGPQQNPGRWRREHQP